jgi:serine/threonine protein phosphatase PrpC
MIMDGDQFTSAAISDRGLNESRPQNEDSYLELRQYGVFAVADGVGGAQAGEVASQMAVEIIGEAFVNIGDDTDPEDTMRIAIERANGAIFQMSRDLPQLASMATTLVALHVGGDIATIAHVGDSRIYRVDATGRLFRETDDHSVVEEEVRAGRMTPEQALVHPSRNVISRALGAEDIVEPDIKLTIIHPATTFLLCSDGITRHITDSEIESLLASDDEPSAICEKMKEICFERGAEDNLTAIIVKFPGEKQSPVVESAADSEDITVASARPPFDALVETNEVDESLHDTLNIEEEIETAEIEPEITEPVLAEAASAVEENDDGAYLLEHPEDIFADEPEPETSDTYTSSSVILPAQEEVTADPEPSRAIPIHGDDHAKESNGFFGSAASAIGLLIAGSLIGLAASYFLVGTNNAPEQTTPTITEQKSNNVTLTAFEDTRRLVDKDPVQYLNAKAATPTEAADFFWLGRALLLTGKPVEAGRAYEEARRLLPSSPEPSNVKTMANEIAMALAIVDNPQAVEAFAKEVSASNSLNGPNSNTNMVINSGRPTR